MFSFKKPTAFYSVLGIQKVTEQIIKSFSPVIGMFGYSCEFSASRIWGLGKCDKGYFCPLVDFKAQIMTNIQQINPSYSCPSLVCQCPEGK